MWGRIRPNARDLLFRVARRCLGFDSQKLARQIPLHGGGVVRNRQPTSPQASTHKIQQRSFCGVHEDRTAAQPDQGRQSPAPCNSATTHSLHSGSTGRPNRTPSRYKMKRVSSSHRIVRCASGLAPAWVSDSSSDTATR